MKPKHQWPAESPRVTAVRATGGHLLELTFSDGTTGTLDLRGWVVGADGVFEALSDPDYFGQVRLSSGGGTIEWPNGVDLCPDVLYSRMTGIPIPFAENPEPAHT